MCPCLTQSILFNIDIEGPLTKDKTAVLRVFAKMFYNHCGFYGDDLKIAKLERFIESKARRSSSAKPLRRSMVRLGRRPAIPLRSLRMTLFLFCNLRSA